MPRISLEVGTENFFGGSSLTTFKQHPAENGTNRRVPARRLAVIEIVLGCNCVLQSFNNFAFFAGLVSTPVDRGGQEVFLNSGDVNDRI